MKYRVHFLFRPESKDQAIETFERIGPHHHPGITFHSAWIGASSGDAFVLVESASEESVALAVEPWKGYGELSIYPVIDIEQY